MQTYRVTSHLDQGTWDSFVETFPEATSYHRYAWREVIEQSFGHETHYLGALDRHGEVQGILPLVHMKSTLFGNFLVSVPFFNYGGLLCRGETPRAVLLEAAEKIRKELGAEHVELRHLQRPVGNLPASTHKVTMILPLAGSVEEQWAGFDAKLRNQIRKAQKNCLCCSVGQLELLDDFYAVFARNMRDLGTPVYSKEFFAQVLGTFRESTRIFAVTLDGRTVGAGISSWYRDTIEMPWASSIAEFKSLCPNNLLYWEAIKFAIKNGFRSFDFGRSTPNEGTYNFKKQWGAKPVQLYWQYLLQEGKELPALNPKNPKYDLAIKLWKRLPVPVTRVLGPHIVRNIP